MRTKAFIFDLDGVIVDTARFHFAAWQEIANQIGIHFSEKENEQLKGVSRVNSLDLILKWANKTITQEEKDVYLKEKNEIYLSNVEKLTKEDVLPGVLDIINYLRENGYKVGLGSASKNARPVLGKLAISELFDAIVDGTNVTRSKPDPQVFAMGAEILKVSPEECLVIEDSLSGLEAAQLIKMKTIGVGGSIELEIADYTYDNLAEIDTDLLTKIIES